MPWVIEHDFVKLQCSLYDMFINDLHFYCSDSKSTLTWHGCFRDLGENHLNGSVPKSFLNLTSLVALWVVYYVGDYLLSILFLIGLEEYRKAPFGLWSLTSLFDRRTHFLLESAVSIIFSYQIIMCSTEGFMTTSWMGTCCHFRWRTYWVCE